MLPVELCVALVATDPAPAPVAAPAPPTVQRPVRREGFLPEGWFLPIGANFGAVSHPTGASGPVAGGEASVVLFPVGHGAWNGVYADVLYDGATQRTRTSLGLEFGYLFLGVDGGPVFQLGDPAPRAGLQVRPMLSLGVVHFYGRWGWFFGGDPQDSKFNEVGVLLKFPIHIADSSLAD